MSYMYTFKVTRHMSSNTMDRGVVVGYFHRSRPVVNLLIYVLAWFMFGFFYFSLQDRLAVANAYPLHCLSQRRAANLHNLMPACYHQIAK